MTAPGNTEEVCVLLSGAATARVCGRGFARRWHSHWAFLSEGWVWMGGEGVGKLGRMCPKGTRHGKLVGLQLGEGRADVQGLRLKTGKWVWVPKLVGLKSAHGHASWKILIDREHQQRRDHTSSSSCSTFHCEVNLHLCNSSRPLFNMYNYLWLLHTKMVSLSLSKAFVLFQRTIKSYRPEDRREKVSADATFKTMYQNSFKRSWWKAPSRPPSSPSHYYRFPPRPRVNFIWQVLKN